jgi:hypothetical protein
MQVARESVAAPENSGKRRLQGNVVDHTGAVLANFNVEVRAKISEDFSAARTTTPMLTLATDSQGEFFAELSPGSYEICVSRFLSSCRTVHIPQTPVELEYLHFKINPSEDHASSELLDNRIRKLAGSSAKNCGSVDEKGNPAEATKCAFRAFKRREAFFVRYDESGFDSEVAHGIAGDALGKVFVVEFDGMGINTGWMPPGATMPDGFHTKVIPCSEPVRLRRTRSGILTCFSDGRWLRGDQ